MYVQNIQCLLEIIILEVTVGSRKVYGYIYKDVMLFVGKCGTTGPTVIAAAFLFFLSLSPPPPLPWEQSLDSVMHTDLLAEQSTEEICQVWNIDIQVWNIDSHVWNIDSQV